MGGVAQEVGGACFVEGPPVLDFVHYVRLNFFCFSSFCADLFFSERAFAIATKVPLRQPDRRGLCFHPGISWFSRGPSELGRVLSEKNGKYV